MDSREKWMLLSEALAFAGNSLLAPMNQTSDIGLAPEFWESFCALGDEKVSAAARSCRDFACAAQASREAGGDPSTRVSVEYTRLFIGPPKPAVAPWESAYLKGAAPGIGFGPAAHQMRTLLRNEGLEIAGKSNQYADHIGIELLFASVLAGRVAEAGEQAASTPAARFAAFCHEHPLSWIASLHGAVEIAAPDGYHARLLELTQALLHVFA